MLCHHFELTRPQVKAVWLQVTGHFRAQRILQALGVFLGPAEPPAEKQAMMTDGDLLSAHDIARQAAEIPAVTNNLHPLMRAGLLPAPQTRLR
ncbi:Uncharacterised protein [Leclercia adecarboxylata]|uniref:Uncharacterized protein n=1 Tax=Leclercia adecarboxylata TaxID=83655 RepID=A0A4U9ISH3_9ENTR|nr:Uncharacterised protein [Leclercia adecarboxylata]